MKLLSYFSCSVGVIPSQNDSSGVLFSVSRLTLMLPDFSFPAKAGRRQTFTLCQYADYAIWAPGAIFGTCSLLAVLFLRMLPESKGRELPQTLGDLEAWYTKSEATGKENNRA
ncbi:hypothetical protein BaRGS_00024264 [Batillaria attramentaria]|uniref:Uncharacterized protein n=1 Tax=Batillaria attramentaria TaxID=370345 RepID=A0ABD0KBM8_9CAEN